MILWQSAKTGQWWWDNTVGSEDIAGAGWTRDSDSINYWLTPDCSASRTGAGQPTSGHCRPGSSPAHWSPRPSQRGQPVRWLAVVSHVLTVDWLWPGTSPTNTRPTSSPARTERGVWAAVLWWCANSHIVTVSSANIVLSTSLSRAPNKPTAKKPLLLSSPLSQHCSEPDCVGCCETQQISNWGYCGHPAGWRSRQDSWLGQLHPTPCTSLGCGCPAPSCLTHEVPRRRRWSDDGLPPSQPHGHVPRPRHQHHGLEEHQPGRYSWEWSRAAC